MTRSLHNHSRIVWSAAIHRRFGRCGRAAAAVLAIALASIAAPLFAADTIVEETHLLARGTNLIRVAVEPIEKDPLKALASIDWESVSVWLPDAAPSDTGRWVTFHKDGPVFLNTLQSFVGPNSFLIVTHASGTLKVKGIWRPDRQPLRSGVYQLYGPKVPESPSSTLDAFRARPATAGKLDDVFEASGGAIRKVSGGDVLKPGTAYFLFPTGELPEPDPINVGSGFGGLHFDAQATLLSIELKINPSDSDVQLALHSFASAAPIGSTDWIELQQPDGTFAALTASSTLDVPAGQSEAQVVLRAQAPTATPVGGVQKAALLEVTGAGGATQIALDLDVRSLRGFWTGEARLSEVERPSFYGGGFAPAAEMPVSLLLEVPTAGQARLLPCIEIVTDRDGRKLHNRLQASMFPDPVPLIGTVSADGKTGTLRGTVSLAADDPLNPYRHRYNPEHREGFAVDRAVTLRFGATLAGADTTKSPLASVGVVTGVYEEEITGLTREPIRTRGVFQLRGVVNQQVTACAGIGQ